MHCCPVRLQGSLKGKGTINVLDFLHRDLYQRKIVFKSTAVDWVRQGVPSHVQTCLSF